MNTIAEKFRACRFESEAAQYSPKVSIQFAYKSKTVLRIFEDGSKALTGDLAHHVRGEEHEWITGEKDPTYRELLWWATDRLDEISREEPVKYRWRTRWLGETEEWAAWRKKWVIQLGAVEALQARLNEDAAPPRILLCFNDVTGINTLHSKFGGNELPVFVGYVNDGYGGPGLYAWDESGRGAVFLGRS